MTFKTNAELNAAEPHLRDLEIFIDGLNIVDIQMAGPGTWVPRMTVQLSGDMGLDKTTGQRSVYLSAAEFLRATLLNNGTGDGKRAHAFVPHANTGREDLTGEADAAIAVAERAIARLMDAFKGVDPENDGKPVADDHFEWYGKSLHIVVRTIDFDLTEKRVLSAQAFNQLQEAIDAPADPSPELVKLMSNQLTPRGTTEDINVDIINTAPSSSFVGSLDDIIHSDVYKEFDGVLHAGVLLEGGFNAPHQVFWIPADKADQFQSLDAIRAGTTLKCVANSNQYVEYLVVLPQDSDDVELDIRNEVKFLDGVMHTRHAFTLEDGDVWVYWVPENYPVKITTINDLPEDSRTSILSRSKGEIQWRVLPTFSKANVQTTTKLFDAVQHTPKYLAAEGDVVTLWVKPGVELNVSCLEEIPADQRVLVTEATDNVVAQWRLL